MLDRRSGSMITVAIAAAAVGAVISTSVTPDVGPGAGRRARPAIEGKPNFSGIWQANNEANWDLQAHAALPAAVTQQGIYPYDYARVPAAPVLALGAAGAVPGSLGVVQGDGQIPYKPEALADEEGERGALDRPRPGAQVLPAGHSARDVHALSVPDHAEHQQDPHRLRVLQFGAHHPSGQGRRAARRYLDGPLGRTMGRRHAGGRRDAISTTGPGSTAPAISTATRCTWSSASRRCRPTSSSTR